MRRVARAIRDSFYGDPAKALPWLCVALGVGAATVTRSPGLGLLTTLLSRRVWDSLSPRMVIEDSRLGAMRLTCPVQDRLGRKQVWLTFDDGPGPETKKLLDVLRQFEAKATFFFIGRNVIDYPDLEGLETVLKTDGHRVGNHSWSHPNFLRLGADATAHEVDQTQQCLRQTFPDTTLPIFRPPFGYRSRSLLEHVSRVDLKPVGWSLNSLDFLSGSTEDLVSRVTQRVEPGTIVLFHDGPNMRERTLEALPSILDHLTSEGYVFTVPNPEELP